MCNKHIILNIEHISKVHSFDSASSHKDELQINMCDLLHPKWIMEGYSKTDHPEEIKDF